MVFPKKPAFEQSQKRVDAARKLLYESLEDSACKQVLLKAAQTRATNATKIYEDSAQKTMKAQKLYEAKLAEVQRKVFDYSWSVALYYVKNATVEAKDMKGVLGAHYNTIASIRAGTVPSDRTKNSIIDTLRAKTDLSNDLPDWRNFQ